MARNHCKYSRETWDWNKMFIATLIEKLRDLEDRSRWKNMWIVGLEEVLKQNH